jgi:hypothetical protein
MAHYIDAVKRPPPLYLKRIVKELKAPVQEIAVV